jgi:hypothetical protein
MTQVTVEQMRTAADFLFSHLESQGVKSVTFPEDYYWDIPADVRYNPYHEPTQHSIGQLSDDFAELTRMIDGSKPVIAWGLVWLAALLRRMGESANC